MVSIWKSASRLCIINRKYSTKWDEIRIPMPWGHLAGKWWGPKDKQPILSSHGWQDNSGTFDTLIPLLPEGISFLTYDFPGHGLSSKLPSGMLYHSIDAVILIRRIIKYYNWSRVSFLGHSFGAHANFTYTMLYPDTVNFLICLDALKPLITDDQLNRQLKAFNDNLKYDHLNSINTEPPSYTFDEMAQKLHEGTRKQIELNACKYILYRNVLPSSNDKNKVYFSRDPRLKTYNIMNWSQKTIIENIHRITCPTLMYIASKAPRFENPNNVLEAVEALKKHNEYFEVYHVEGSHHVHLNNPERVAGLINKFLCKYATQQIAGNLKNDCVKS